MSILAGATLRMPILFPVFGTTGWVGMFGPIFVLGAVLLATRSVMHRTLISIPDVLLPDWRDAMKPDASPTARALLALELIQGSPGITADRLADKPFANEHWFVRANGQIDKAKL